MNDLAASRWAHDREPSVRNETGQVSGDKWRGATDLGTRGVVQHGKRGGLGRKWWLIAAAMVGRSWQGEKMIDAGKRHAPDRESARKTLMAHGLESRDQVNSVSNAERT